MVEHKRTCYDLNSSEYSLNRDYRERTYDINSYSWTQRNAKEESLDDNDQRIQADKKSNLELLQELNKKDLQKLLLKGI